MHELVKGQKILLVDDEADILATLKNGLEEHGFVVDAFDDPGVALSRFKPHAYDLLILDIRMPGMSGFQLLREIRKNDSTVKAVFLTAFDIRDSEWEKVLPSSEVGWFVTKPVRLGSLIRVVSQAT